MLVNRVDLSPAQTISCFLSGLNEEIQCAVRMFKPSSLHEAYCWAKLQEVALASIARKKPILEKPRLVTRNFSSYRGSAGSSLTSPLQRYAGRSNATGTHVGPKSIVSSTGSVTSKPRKILTSREIDEKRTKGMCFFCDEKYYPGHKCAGQVYSLELVEEHSGEEGQERNEEDCGSSMLQEEEQPLISLQALQGVSSYQTMRVKGRVGSQTLHILSDTGSTHNFLDAATAKKLRCELLKIAPLVVVVAEGAQLQCQMICKGLQLRLGDMDYVTGPYIVPLGSCDMILGVQWLATLGSILWDFKKLTMEFMYKGRRHLLQGFKRGELLWAAEGKQGLFNQAAQLFAVHISSVHPELNTL